MSVGASGMIRGLADRVLSGFSDNPARLISVARILLALSCSAVVACSSAPGSTLTNGVLALFVAYSFFAVCTAVIGARSWWMGARLVPLNSLADGGLFLVLLLRADGQTSLCFPLFLLLLLSSGQRLGRNRAILIALGMLLAGALGIAVTGDFMYILPYLAALTLFAFLVVLFHGRIEPENRLVRWRDVADGIRDSELPLPLVLARIETLFGADRVIFTWHDADVERHRLVLYEQGEPSERSCTAEEFSRLKQAGIDGDDSFIFDAGLGHVVVSRSGGSHVPVQVERFANLVDPPMAQGLCITVDCQAATGRLFVIRERGASERDFKRVGVAKVMMEAALDRYQVVEAIRSSAFNNARLAMARNIHDGVVQNLAGFGMRFGAMKLDLIAGRVTETLHELDKLQSLVREEQLGLRALIQKNQDGAEERCNVVPLLRELASTLAQQWKINCSVSAFPDPIMIPVRLGSELGFLVREAVANAARHAQASWVRVSVGVDDDSIRLLITSDRNGEASTIEAQLEPRSLSTRVEELGGSIILKQKATGTHLTAFLPTKGEPTWRGY